MSAVPFSMCFLPRSLSLLLIACQLVVAVSHAQGVTVYRGRPVQEALDELRAAGSPLVYSSNLLPRSLLVLEEPKSDDPLTRARELLSPHGLTVREADGVWLVVREEVAAPAPGRVAIRVAAATAMSAVSNATAQLDAPAGPVLGIVQGQAEFAGVSSGRHMLTIRAPGYLPERVPVTVTADEVAVVEIELIDAAPKLDELTVTASRYDLINDIQPSGTYFSRDEIESLSELGNDTLRIAHRLPGIASGEFSSRSHVRGGASDEMTVILDGMELVEPFHLRDYQGVFSAIDQRIISGIQIYSGGFPAAYGDALSGLTVIDQRAPTAPLRHELGLSLLYTSVLSSGTFLDGRAEWLASVRRGNIDSLLSDELGEPSYRDAFVHL
ncbi:MAG TPA: TonB-dependent receptor plug domain-containing protein, partial [Gammaproteobacteria bacterium]|nr:TonB-dependent receptor plug domain-containing protein [Gammaproteobacteria bacterium]